MKTQCNVETTKPGIKKRFTSEVALIKPENCESTKKFKPTLKYVKNGSDPQNFASNVTGHTEHFPSTTFEPYFVKSVDFARVKFCVFKIAYIFVAKILASPTNEGNTTMTFNLMNK